MKRAFAWAAGLVGIAALGRLLARRRRAPRPEESRSGVQPASVTPDPAAELRDRLAAQRASGQAPDPAAGAAGSETLEQRRARIHAEAQEAIEAMKELSP